MPLYDFWCDEGHEFERVVGLADFDVLQSCACGAPAHRKISAPRVVSDVIEPIYGADGKLHDSLSSYRASLRPDGNPKGERFYEMGNDTMPEFKAPEFDEGERRDAIKAAIADVKLGKPAPELATGIPT